MQLQHLKAFYDVALSRSFLAASKKIRITQPALSRSVQSLEASLGKTLFVREARGVSLTAEGREVFDRCRIIFAECDAISEKASPVSKSVRLAASENLCLHVLPKIVSQLRPDPPTDKFDFVLTSGTASEVVASVINGQAELGYCYHSAKTSGITSREVAEVEFTLVVGAKANIASVKELTSLPFVGSKTNDYSGPFAAKSLLSRVGLKEKAVTYQCNSQEAQLALVEAGIGFTVVPWFAASSRVRAGKLRELSTRAGLSSTLYAITKDQFTPTKFQRELEAAIKSAVTR